MQILAAHPWLSCSDIAEILKQTTRTQRKNLSVWINNAVADGLLTVSKRTRCIYIRNGREYFRQVKVYAIAKITVPLEIASGESYSTDLPIREHVLNFLKANDGFWSSAEIAKAIGEAKPTIDLVTRRLFRAGQVNRETDTRYIVFGRYAKEGRTAKREINIYSIKR
jgi:predicted transcriptional regulator